MRLPLSAALTVLAVLATPARDAFAQAQRGGRVTKGYNSGGLTRSVARNVSPAYLEFATPSGTGLPVAEDLCSALAAEVPNWATPVGGGAGNWCLGGDGQEVAGSEADFSPAGSPVASSPSFCPSGLDCATKTATWLGSISDAHASAAKTSTSAAPMSACWLGMHTTGAVWDNFLFGPGWALALKSDDTYRFTIASTETSTGGLSLLAVNLVCGTYSGTAKGYFNGAPGSTSGALTRAVATTANTLRGYPSASLTFGAFYVDQELSAAKIAAIARRVLADQPKAVVNGSPSLALTYTRSGVSYCSKNDNTGTLLSPNRPCVSQNGILVEAAGTNLVVRSQEFNSWSSSLGATVTANYALAPDGTKTADRLVYTGNDAYLYQPETTTALKTQSIFLKGTSGSGSINIGYGGANTYYSTCSYTSAAWTRCTRSATDPSANNFVIGCAITPGAMTSCPASGDVLVWGAQTETGSVATSYIPTTSAAATRGASLAYFTHGQTAYATGCIGASRSFPLAMSNYANSGFVSLESDLVGNFQQSIISFGGLGGWVGQVKKVTATLPTTAGTDRVYLQWDGAGTTLSTNGVVVTDTAGTPAATTHLRIGNYGGGTLDSNGMWTGRYSNIQFDTNPARCR